MSTESLPKTPSERADRLATNVHTLWGLHQQRFAEMLKAADKEARAYLRQKAADDVAEQKNRRAVFAEWKALQTKKAKPRLTDPDPQKQPGPDWYWNESHHLIGMDEDGNIEKVPIRAWYRRPRAVTPLDFDSPVEAKRPSLAMRYAALAAAHDLALPDDMGMIGRDAPLAGVLDVLRGGWFYGYQGIDIRDIPDGPGFDKLGMDRLEAFYDMVKADLESHQMQNLLQAPEQKGLRGTVSSQPQTKQVPWSDDADEYLPNSEAVKLSADVLNLKRLGGLLKPNGPMRYMRNGRRTKVHLQDFRQYIRTHGSHDISDKTVEEYLRGVDARKEEERERKQCGR